VNVDATEGWILVDVLATYAWLVLFDLAYRFWRGLPIW
jgi:hypothetical protein